MKIPGLSDIVNKAIGDIYNLVKDEIRHTVSNQLLEYQSSLYDASIKQKTLLIPNESVNINDFYVPLSLRNYNTYKGRSAAKIDTSSVTKLFQQDDNLVIFGYAGSGKSTLVKSLILSSIEERYKFPILVELRNMESSVGDFDNYIYENIFKYQKLGLTTDIIERLLFSGNFFFILDGFDEIKDVQKNRVGTNIKDFVRKFRRNNYVITSRHYEALNSFDGFRTLEVCELDESERNIFIEKQINVLKIDSSLARQIITELNKTKNYSIRQYLNNPLLLSLLIITYITKKEIPFNKSEFYYNIFDSLFHRLDRMLKTGYVHEKVSGLSKDEFLTVLASFSFVSFFKQQYEFTIEYFEKTIEEIKKKQKMTFKTQDFTNDIVLNIGIMEEEGMRLRFPHRSLQEYFAAHRIMRLDHEKKKNFCSSIVGKTNDVFFVSILLELDYLNAVEFFVVPLIDFFVRYEDNIRLSNLQLHVITKTEMYDLIQNIFDDNEYLRNIMKKFQLETFSSSKDDSGNFELTDWTNYKRTVFVQNFQRNGGLLVKSLIEHVQTFKQQDQGLIDMID